MQKIDWMGLSQQDIDQIRAEARVELEKEKRDRLRAEYKQYLRTRRPWWHYIIPFTVRFEWRRTTN